MYKVLRNNRNNTIHIKIIVLEKKLHKYMWYIKKKIYVIIFLFKNVYNLFISLYI